MSITSSIWATSEWSPSSRAAYNRDLQARFGCDLTTASDALEVLGQPRLGASTPAQRASARDILATERGREAIAYVRETRAETLAHLKSQRTLTRLARAELGLEVPSKLRLPELLQLEAMVWTLEVRANELEAA